MKKEPDAPSSVLPVSPVAEVKNIKVSPLLTSDPFILGAIEQIEEVADCL